MTTAVILLVSGVLIGAGIGIIWRDARAKRRGAFVTKRDARAKPDPESEAEITISYDPRPAATPAPPLAVTDAPAPPAPDVGEPSLPKAEARHPEPSRPGVHLPLEQEWANLQPALAAGVDKINAVLAPVRLSVAPTGEPSWSYKNRGYGAYRRLLLGGESMAWMRLELSPDGRLHASVKAHKDDRAEINAATDVAAKGLNAAGASDLLAQCLRLAATHAARQQPGGRDIDEEASEQAWRSIDGVVAAALRATNGALAQADARLIPLAPAAWEAELRRYRMTLSVEVHGDDVARMHIERHLHEMEVAVGVREPQLIDLGRRRRVPVEGMTIHALAELIASCAWPAIERFRETRRPA
jgi:hypothetical protein